MKATYQIAGRSPFPIIPSFLAYVIERQTMTTARVTKIVCPSCEGSGILDLFSGPHGSLPCQWCQGAKRLPAAEAEKYADWQYTIGIGGFIAGDHDLPDAKAMEAKARAIFALLGTKPTWERKPSPKPVVEAKDVA